jgi:predicted  nucleic acid-binding Zn-ribbon protein
MKKHELKSKLKLCEASNLKLLLDLDRLHRERDSFQQQARALADEVERLNDELTRIKSTIAGFLNDGAVGERGHACMSIDGGNL